MKEGEGREASAMDFVKMDFVICGSATGDCQTFRSLSETRPRAPAYRICSPLDGTSDGTPECMLFRTA